jgi:hypothetical protein
MIVFFLLLVIAAMALGIPGIEVISPNSDRTSGL